MRPQITVKGIVLSSSMVGDYDKRVVILTKERGKITAFARGVRRPKSMLMAVCQPLNYGQFVIYESYDAYTLISGQIEEYFMDVKEDLDKVCYGSYFCEVIDYLTVEGNCDKDVINLLYISFKALVKHTQSYELIRRIFEFKILALDGEAIHCFSCVKCNDGKEMVGFNSIAGGMVCEKCFRELMGSIRISQSSIYTIQYIISSPIEKLYTFNVSEEVLNELKMIGNRYFPMHVDKKFKSLEILDTLS